MHTLFTVMLYSFETYLPHFSEKVLNMSLFKTSMSLEVAQTLANEKYVQRSWDTLADFTMERIRMTATFMYCKGLHFKFNNFFPTICLSFLSILLFSLFCITYLFDRTEKRPRYASLLCLQSQ